MLLETLQENYIGNNANAAEAGCENNHFADDDEAGALAEAAVVATAVSCAEQTFPEVIQYDTRL